MVERRHVVPSVVRVTSDPRVQRLLAYHHAEVRDTTSILDDHGRRGTASGVRRREGTQKGGGGAQKTEKNRVKRMHMPRSATNKREQKYKPGNNAVSTPSTPPSASPLRAAASRPNSPCVGKF
jgi:hypothetical protein